MIGLDEITGLESKTVIFPNPSNGIVNLLVDSEEEVAVNYSLYDSMGREVKKGCYIASKHGTEALMLNQFPSGVYVLKVQYGLEIHIERIMIE